MAPSARYLEHVSSASAADLRREVADLLAVVTLPAVWQTAAPREIAESLAETLRSRLQLDLVALRIDDTPSPMEIAVPAAVDWERLESAARSPGATGTVSLPGSGGVARVVAMRPLGERGMVWAGAAREGFPTPHEETLIRVAVDQAALAMQSSRQVHDRARLLDAEKEMRRNAEARQRRAAFLADATAALAATFEYEAALDKVARTAVASFCDAVVIDPPPPAERVVAAIDSTSERALLDDVALQTSEETEHLTGQEALLRLASTAEARKSLRRFRIRDAIVAPIRSREGVRGHFIALTRETSYQREDVEIAEELARRIGLAIDNALLYREAREADRRKDEFLAILGHELRNPLAPIVTALRVMKMKGGAELAKERELMQRQVEHLVRLVDDLLDVSRITRGKITLQRETVSIGTILEKAVEMTLPLVEQRRHRLQVEKPAAHVCVLGDAARLAQVVANLLNNAAKYMEPGGTIQLTATTDGAEVVIRVRDSGVGISPELLPKIFDLFIQDGRSIDRSEGGLGIGLAVVRSLVQLHGGSVRAESAGAGKGSEFVIRLPAAVMESVKNAPPPPDRSPPSRARRVLVVDDNRDAALLLAELLTAMGHEVRLAHDGPSALGEARSFAPEAVLLDIGLPLMDGYEVASRLRGDEQTRRMHLIAVTGYGQEKDRRRALEAGFDAHLVKPVPVERLLELLDRGAVSARAAQGP